MTHLDDGEPEQVIGVLMVADKMLAPRAGELPVATHISEEDITMAELVVDACASHLGDGQRLGSGSSLGGRGRGLSSLDEYASAAGSSYGSRHSSIVDTALEGTYLEGSTVMGGTRFDEDNFSEVESGSAYGEGSVFSEEQ